MKIAVPSLSREGEHYVVDATAWTCTCPRYDFSPRENKGCKHIELVRHALLLTARCAAQHQTRDDNLCPACLVGLMGTSARRVRRNFVPKKVRKRKRKEEST